MLILEENFKWHLEAFASELFIYIYIIIGPYEIRFISKFRFFSILIFLYCFNG